MNSIKKITEKDANWDARLDSLTPLLKHKAKRQREHKLRQQHKLELRNMSEICVCCGAQLGNAELGTMVCDKCRPNNF